MTLSDTPNIRHPGWSHYVGPQAAWCLLPHHDILCEYCSSFQERWKHVLRKDISATELSIRAAHFVVLKEREVPLALRKAWEAWETAREARETAQEAWEKAWETAQEAGETAQEAGEKAREAREKAGEKAQEAGEKAREAREKAREKAREAREKAGEKAQEAGEKAREAWKAWKAYEKVLEEAQPALEALLAKYVLDHRWNGKEIVFPSE